MLALLFKLFLFYLLYLLLKGVWSLFLLYRAAKRAGIKFRKQKDFNREKHDDAIEVNYKVISED